jgi:(2Fe-2S) ferredoxin
MSVQPRPRRRQAEARGRPPQSAPRDDITNHARVAAAGYKDGVAEPHFEKHVFVCTNKRDPGNPKGCCWDKGSEAVRDEFKRLLHERGVKGRIRANAAGCLDQCARGVTVVVYPEQVWYGGVKVDDVREIVEDHLLGGVPVERLRMK